MPKVKVVRKRRRKPEKETRARLLEAAERLLAEKGFDAVTIRDVTEAAAANVAAVNYHFRNRESLVDEVIVSYVRPINEERLARLESLEKGRGGKPLALEEILEAWIRPFATQVRRSELSERIFGHLMARIFGTPGHAVPKEVEQDVERCIARFSKAFQKALPNVEAEELVWRMRFVMGGLLHLLGGNDEEFHRLSGGQAGRPTLEQTLSRFLRFASAGLRGEESVAMTDPSEKPGGSKEGFLF
jgi:AcrR family transcriptional regulator